MDNFEKKEKINTGMIKSQKVYSDIASMYTYQHVKVHKNKRARVTDDKMCINVLLFPSKSDVFCFGNKQLIKIHKLFVEDFITLNNIRT